MRLVFVVYEHLRGGVVDVSFIAVCVKASEIICLTIAAPCSHLDPFAGVGHAFHIHRHAEAPGFYVLEQYIFAEGGDEPRFASGLEC